MSIKVYAPGKKSWSKDKGIRNNIRCCIHAGPSPRRRRVVIAVQMVKTINVKNTRAKKKKKSDNKI